MCTIFSNLVLGFQISNNFAGIQVGGASSCELNTSGGLRLALQFQQTEVVALAKHIPGRFTQISIDRRSHLVFACM